jgi:glycosyltransferase involved in cell wall biosynthesis
VRVAIVNQPFSFIDLPRDDAPLSADSIGLWTYHVAIRLARRWPVVVYTPEDRAFGSRRSRHAGVEFVGVPVRLERRLMSAANRLRRSRAGEPAPGRNETPAANRAGGRPAFASRAFYLPYALRTALDARRRGCEAAVVTNLTQFPPLLRALNPRARIALNMECDWLPQLDRASIDRRLEACDLISGCSAFITERVGEAFPRHRDRCFTLYNGVDVGAFLPAAEDDGSAPGRPDPALPDGGSRPRRDAGQHILYVGRVSPEKGVHVLLEAFGELARRFADARLSIIGARQAAPSQLLVGVDGDPLVRGLTRFYRDGPNAYQEFLDRALPAGVAERVSFRGHRPHFELIEAYRGADVFVAPSVCQEPFGIGVVEAMACGLPVVATRGGGFPELVEHGRSGLLVERDDAAGLAAALDTLLRGPSLGRSMGAAGRRRALGFSWERTAERLAEKLAEGR